MPSSPPYIYAVGLSLLNYQRMYPQKKPERRESRKNDNVDRLALCVLMRDHLRQYT